jgi:hypothetical protein
MMRFPGFGVFPVVWFFTDDDTFDMETIYNSHNHSREDGYEDMDLGTPGEVWGATRTYHYGNRPDWVICGEPFGSQSAWNGETDSTSPVTPTGYPGTGASHDFGHDYGYDS